MNTTQIDVQNITVSNGLILFEIDGLPSALKNHKLIFTDARDDGVLELTFYDHKQDEVILTFVPDKKDFAALLRLGKSTSFTVIGSSGKQTESVQVSYPLVVMKSLNESIHTAYRHNENLNESVSEKMLLLG